MSVADHHRRTAGNFAAIVAGTRDWDAPTPVPEWRAHDVVEHLLTWLPAVLGAWAGIDLPDTGRDLPARWRARTAEVQRLLDDPRTAGRELASGPFAGQRLDDVVDRIYTADVFAHTWDLAVSSGQDPALDAVTAGDMLAGMRPIEEMLRSSGQYGPAVPTDSSDPVEQFVAFLGRDPRWRP